MNIIVFIVILLNRYVLIEKNIFKIGKRELRRETVSSNSVVSLGQDPSTVPAPIIRAKTPYVCGRSSHL